MLRSFLCLLLCTAALPAHADTPSSIHAYYDVSFGSFKVATVTETFTRTGDHYTLENLSQAVGLLALIKPETIRATSEGTITADGLRPLTFISTRKLDTDRNVRADFDWTHRQITLTNRYGKTKQPLLPDTQDVISAIHQFMFMPLKNVTQLKLDITNGNKVDVYSYTFTPDQNITIPLGSFNTTYAASVEEKRLQPHRSVASGGTCQLPLQNRGHRPGWPQVRTSADSNRLDTLKSN